MAVRSKPYDSSTSTMFSNEEVDDKREADSATTEEVDAAEAGAVFELP